MDIYNVLCCIFSLIYLVTIEKKLVLGTYKKKYEKVCFLIHQTISLNFI